MKITEDDSEDIGFVVVALMSQAISTSELREWATRIVQNESDFPTYILDLMDFDRDLCDVYKIIGFVPIFSRTLVEEKALFGIASLRGFDVHENIDKREALDALSQSSRIRKKFNELFPFIEGGP